MNNNDYWNTSNENKEIKAMLNMMGYTKFTTSNDGAQHMFRTGAISRMVPKIKDVKFNNPATIVWWVDGTKTVVTCMDNVARVMVKDKDGNDVVVRKPRPANTYDKYIGLAMCITKKALGNKSNFNTEISKWIRYDEKRIKKFIDETEAAERAKMKRLEEEAKRHQDKLERKRQLAKLSALANTLCDQVKTNDD